MYLPKNQGNVQIGSPILSFATLQYFLMLRTQKMESVTTLLCIGRHYPTEFKVHIIMQMDDEIFCLVLFINFQLNINLHGVMGVWVY
jgi:hypothetical protein